jgi:hypothetical protein
MMSVSLRALEIKCHFVASTGLAGMPGPCGAPAGE